MTAQDFIDHLTSTYGEKELKKLELGFYCRTTEDPSLPSRTSCIVDEDTHPYCKADKLHELHDWDSNKEIILVYTD